MDYITEISIVVLLTIITWQDFTTREISVLLFPAVTILLIYHAMKYADVEQLFLNFSFNIGFLTAQLFMLFYYLRLRYGKNPGMFSNYFGWGDVLLLASVCMLFSLYGFMLFIITSSLVSLVVALAYGWMKKKKMQQIPFAAVAALVFLVFWFTNLVSYPEEIFDTYALR
ncbi:MAG: prepilin peptidase [Flavobacteriales bacterium]